MCDTAVLALQPTSATLDCRKQSLGLEWIAGRGITTLISVVSSITQEFDSQE